MMGKSKTFDQRALKALVFYHDQAIRDAGKDHMISFWRGAVTATRRMTDDVRVRRLADRLFDRMLSYKENN